MKNNTWVRDTLIFVSVYNELSVEKQQKIDSLITEFNSINYIDARTQLGPDQIRRMSEKQRLQLANNMQRVFNIESQLRELIKPEAQIKKEAEEKAKKEAEQEILRIKYRIRDIENFLQRHLQTSRENTTKKEYRELKEKLERLTT